jgi:hypothetical protein
MWFDKENMGEAVELLKQYQREWDEEKKAFRDKPRHDHTSHCADAFRMMAISYREKVKDLPKKQPNFPIKGAKSGIITIPLDDLWGETRISKERY